MIAMHLMLLLLMVMVICQDHPGKTVLAILPTITEFTGTAVFQERTARTPS
jgi:hypothetical protein